MESRESIKADLEAKKNRYLQIGFIFSLAFMLLLLELMSYFSIHKSNSTLYIAIPVEMGMAKDLNQMTPEQQQSTPAKAITSPTKNLLDVIANSVIVSDDIALENGAKIKADPQDSRISGNGYGANGEADVEDAMPFTIVEEPPTYPGGTDALIKFLRDNLRYPYIAKEKGISGTVSISFFVEKDGSISNVKVIRGVGGGCNEEAIRVVSMMPKWSPGRQRGKAVITQNQIPIIFSLGAK